MLSWSVAAILVANTVLAVLNVRSMRTAAESVNRSHAGFGALDHVSSTLKDAEIGQQGFLLTGDEDELARYRAAVGQMKGALEQVGILTASDAVQQGRIVSLRRLLAEKIAELDRTLVPHHRGAASARAAESVRAARESRTAEPIRRLTAEIGAREDRLLRRREAASRGCVQRTIGCMALANGLALSLVLVAHYLERHDRSNRSGLSPFRGPRCARNKLRTR
jgi:CHASE3 domain sensor protein